VLTEIEIHEDNRDAVAVATTAYRLAWCDGPPFAYHYGLTAARAPACAWRSRTRDAPARRLEA